VRARRASIEDADGWIASLRRWPLGTTPWSNASTGLLIGPFRAPAPRGHGRRVDRTGHASADAFTLLLSCRLWMIPSLMVRLSSAQSSHDFTRGSVTGHATAPNARWRRRFRVGRLHRPRAPLRAPKHRSSLHRLRPCTPCAHCAASLGRDAQSPDGVRAYVDYAAPLLRLPLP
jgi:hypothetical protein